MLLPSTTIAPSGLSKVFSSAAALPAAAAWLPEVELLLPFEALLLPPPLQPASSRAPAATAVIRMVFRTMPPRCEGATGTAPAPEDTRDDTSRVQPRRGPPGSSQGRSGEAEGGHRVDHVADLLGGVVVHQPQLDRAALL